jgi:hypothetical protein
MAEQQRQRRAGDGAGIASRPLGVPARDGELLGDAFGTADDSAGRVDEPPVRPPAHGFEHLRPATGEPQRWRDTGKRRQLDDGVLELPEPAVVRDGLLRLQEGTHEARRLDQARIALPMVVAVRPDVLPLPGG